MQETARDADLHANEKAIGVVLPCLDGERVGDAGGGGCHTNSTLEVLCFVSQSRISKKPAGRRREKRDALGQHVGREEVAAAACGLLSCNAGQTGLDHALLRDGARSDLALVCCARC